jgi:spore maturation protein CgeB
MKTSHDSSEFRKHSMLVLDGISGLDLAREITSNSNQLGVRSIYVNLASLKAIRFYRLRSVMTKSLNKINHNDSFFYLPKNNEKNLVDIIDQYQPSHILVVGFLYKYVNPIFLRKYADKHNIKLILYDTDSCNIYTKRREFIFFIAQELAQYHYIFSFSAIMARFFKDTCQLPALYAPYGAEAVVLPAQSSQQYDVTFIGAADLRRIFVLEHIKDKVSIFGNRWERNELLMSSQLKSRLKGKAVWGHDLHELLSQSKIVLNITRSQFYGAETGVNLRIFEALAAGCFLITDYCDEVNQLFKVGVEIETFKSSNELKDKIHYYLSNSDKRIEIARNGHQAFLERFTWAKRLKPILESVGLL